MSNLLDVELDLVKHKPFSYKLSLFHFYIVNIFFYILLNTLIVLNDIKVKVCVDHPSLSIYLSKVQLGWMDNCMRGRQR